jgi:hypothetical protein
MYHWGLRMRGNYFVQDNMTNSTFLNFTHLDPTTFKFRIEKHLLQLNVSKELKFKMIIPNQSGIFIKSNVLKMAIETPRFSELCQFSTNLDN